ncbi:MAG: imelysin family protein [Sumerlaeia bacterium]
MPRSLCPLILLLLALLPAALPAQDPATAHRVIARYAALGFEHYERATEKAEDLERAVETFLLDPSAVSETRAREAWTEAFRAYCATEAFRFSGNPIDAAANGPEPMLNAWPVNGKVVETIVVDTRRFPELTTELLQKAHAPAKAQVTTGFHVIEYFLFGPRPNAEGPGAEPFADFTRASPSGPRRAAYLRLAAELLVDQLRYVTDQWRPGSQDNYATALLRMEEPEALRRILLGMAALSGTALAEDRLPSQPAALMSAIADTSGRDFLTNAVGVHIVYRGGFDEEIGPGIYDLLVAAGEGGLAEKLDARMQRSVALLARIPKPYSAAASAEPGSPGAEANQAAIANLKAQAIELAEAGQRLGVENLAAPAESVQ